MYNSIFSGSSPDFPIEDTKEHLLSCAKDSFDAAQLQSSTESNVLSILQNALILMNQCIATLDDALQSSSLDTWGIGGGGSADMTERSSLAQTQYLSSRVEILISQARGIQPAVQTLGPMNVAQGNLMSDVIFDNILSDLNFHDAIEKSKRQVEAAHARLKQEMEHSSERPHNFRLEVKELKEFLEMRRKELQDGRARVFERVVANGGISNNYQQTRSTVEQDQDHSGWQSPSLQWDSQQHMYNSLFGVGYQEQQSRGPELYRAPPAGTYNLHYADPDYSWQDLAMPVPS